MQVDGIAGSISMAILSSSYLTVFATFKSQRFVPIAINRLQSRRAIVDRNTQMVLVQERSYPQVLVVCERKARSMQVCNISACDLSTFSDFVIEKR